MKELLTHPWRLLVIAVGGMAGVVGLVLAGAHAPYMAVALLGILLVGAGLLAIKVPTRLVLWLAGGAVIVVVGVSVGIGVVAAGPLSVLAMLAGLLGIGWMTRGLLGTPPAPADRGSRWADVWELEEAKFFEAYGWPLGSVGRRILRLPERLERENVIVCAAPGSGKSAGLAKPAILSEADRPPERQRIVVIVDPKDELTRDTLPTLAKTHQPLVWDPSDPDACTVGFDPLASLPTVTDESFVGEIKHVARAWFDATRGGSQHSNEPPFFVNQPRSLMEALFLTFRVTHPQGTFVELAQWNATLTIEAFQELLDHSSHPAVRASAETLRAVGLNERTIGPIWGDVLQRWDILIDPRVCRSMSGSPIDWASLLIQERPVALYLRIGAHDAQRLAPLLSMAMGQLYREVTKVASRYPNNMVPHELRIIADEFGNLPRVYEVETALATLRSYGVGHFLFVQSSSQITHRYGHDVAQSIQNSIVTKLILGGAALDDAKLFSERCGEVTEQIDTESLTKNGILQKSSTYSYSPDRRPLISATDIVHMADTVLVSTRGVMPICARLRMYFEDQALMQRLAKDRGRYELVHLAEKAARARPPTPTPTDPTAYTDDEKEVLPGAGPRQRDTPPPKCSQAEWQSAPASLVAARWALEDALFQLAIGEVGSMDELQSIWQAHPELSPPRLYATITQADREHAPNVAAHVTELAMRLDLVDDEPPVSAQHEGAC